MKLSARTILLALAVILILGGVCMAETVSGSPDMKTATYVFAGEKYIIHLGSFEKEWFAFQADPDSAYYRFDTKNEEIGTTVYMELFDQNGISLRKVDGGKGSENYISWKLTPNETYFLSFSRYNQKHTGRITLNIEKTPDIYENTIEKAHEVKEGETILSTMDGTGDIDCFVFTTGAASAFYRAEFKNETVGTTMYMEILDKNGLKIERKENTKGDSNYFSWKAEPESVYYLKFYPYNTEKTGKYTFSFSSTPDNEADLTENANRFDAGEPVHASFDGYGDVDVFTFTSDAGSVFYQANLKNEDVATTAYMEVLDQNGLQVLKTEARKGDEASLSWKAEPEKIYYLKFSCYDKNKTGKYVFTLITTPDAEPDSFETAALITAGGRSEASFDGTGDEDVFKITMDGESEFVRADFKNENVNTTVYLEIFDEYENSLFKKEAQKGKEQFVSWKGEAEKTYYLRFYRYDKNKTGKYLFTLLRTPDNEPDDMDSAFVVPANGWVMASFDGTGDEDWFEIETKDGNVFYDLTFKNESVKYSVYAEIFDQNGYSLFKGEASTGKEKSILWNALDADCAYVRFTRYDKAHTGEYAFMLSEKEDVGGNSPDTAFTVQAGEEAIITKDQEKDVDYVAFPEENASILIVNRSDKWATVCLVDSYDMPIGDERRFHNGDSAVFENGTGSACVRIKTDGDQVFAYCCTPGNHTPDESWQVLKEATCEYEGAKAVMCVVCGQPAGEEVIPKAAHEAGEWTAVRKADCEENGLDVRVCVNCGYETERRELAALGHEYGNWIVEIEAGCEADGLQKQMCIYCQKVIKIEKIPAFGHIGGEWETEEGDCETDTVKTRACRLCGEIMETEVIKATGHKKGEAETVREAGCESDGFVEEKCIKCGKTLNETIIPAFGHDFGSWAQIKEPTFSEAGLEERVCKNCGETEQREIEKKSIKGGLFGNNQ